MTGVLAALASLVVAVGAPTTLVVNAVPAAHGARAVLTLQATFEVQCGRVTQLTVSLPSAMGVQAPIAPGSVAVNGLHPASIRTSSHLVQVTMPPPHGVMCDSIGPARITVRFTRAAGLVNPTRPGSYAVSLRMRAQTAAGRLKIT